MTSSLNGKTLFISGASRGIGLAIAVRAAADGANIILVAKTTEANPKLPGTLYSVAEEIEDPSRNIPLGMARCSAPPKRSRRPAARRSSCRPTSVTKRPWPPR